jgi:hypothetical protein
LIIESGFAYALPLLRLIGVDTEGLGLTESTGFRNIDKIRRWTKPTLIIHAEWDQIIPLSDAKALYDACSAADTQLLPIPMANHNDIFFRGYNQYLSAVKAFTDRVLQG